MLHDYIFMICIYICLKRSVGFFLLILCSAKCPGEENGHPFQESCQENSMDRGARWAIVQGVAKSQI